jgi:hypothetical protein
MLDVGLAFVRIWIRVELWLKAGWGGVR